jgi:hypothetical protein
MPEPFFKEGEEGKIRNKNEREAEISYPKEWEYAERAYIQSQYFSSSFQERGRAALHLLCS